MNRKLPQTPASVIRSALRRLWLRSRERTSALKRESYTCERCEKKQSRAKGREVFVEVHHLDGVDWSGLLDLIRERLLHKAERLEVLCDECHKGEERRKAEEAKK